jgi:hypothetical protein
VQNSITSFGDAQKSRGELSDCKEIDQKKENGWERMPRMAK